MRCFIACFVEDGTVELMRLGGQITGVRPVAAENLHATLRFLGEIDEAQVPRINQLVTHLQGTRIITPVCRLDGFPERRRARVVVARLGDETPLHSWANELAETLGEPDRPFVAHVTLGRSRKGTSIPHRADLAGFEITLSAPAFYESVGGSSIVYRTVEHRAGRPI